MNLPNRASLSTTCPRGVNMTPRALAPPKGANPHAVDHWFTACKNLPADPRLARAQALRKYVQLCDSAGLLPFAAQADPNIAIRNFLGTRRRLYVRYADLTKFMKPLFVRKITRDAYLTEYGFAIRIEGWVRVSDPLWFRHIKATPGWRFSLTWDKEYRYTVKLDPGITVYVRNPSNRSPTSWYVGYEIHCPVTPDLPDFKPATILKRLWDPIASSVRPKNTLPQRRI
jgi:hypothetical protein